MIVERVPAGLSGERIDRVVAFVAGCSRADAAALVTEGAVRVGDHVVHKVSSRVAEGDEVVIDYEAPGEPEPPQPDASVPVEARYEDAEVIVIDKPPGLVVHPGSGHLSGTLVNGLLARFPDIAGVGDPARPGIVHRLDRDTSGLLMVARTPAAYAALSAQLADRSASRAYRALVWGRPGSTRGLIDAPIGRSPRDPTRMAVVRSGREARTHYEVRNRFARPAETAELVCRLETGRTHQIRVHLASIGHPVVGDDRYGGNRAGIVPPRVFLHAEHLVFVHPGTGETVEFSSPLPADLAEVLDGLD